MMEAGEVHKLICRYTLRVALTPVKFCFTFGVFASLRKILFYRLIISVTVFGTRDSQTVGAERH
jgi:hypothetical protein